jgi:hypothetical protein
MIEYVESENPICDSDPDETRPGVNSEARSVIFVWMKKMRRILLSLSG